MIFNAGLKQDYVLFEVYQLTTSAIINGQFEEQFSSKFFGHIRL